jgi:hypothetical protein
MPNADLIKILELRLAEARVGKITDVLAVFGPGAGNFAFTALDDTRIPAMLGDFEVFKPALVNLFLQGQQRRAHGIVPVRGDIPQMDSNLWKKINGG